MALNTPSRWRSVAFNLGIWVLALLLLASILAVSLGVRLLMTGGDWGCVAAKDPQLCVAVKETERNQ